MSALDRSGLVSEAAAYLECSDGYDALYVTVSEFREWLGLNGQDVAAYSDEQILASMVEARASLPVDCDRCDGTGEDPGTESGCCERHYCDGGSMDWPTPVMARPAKEVA